MNIQRGMSGNYVARIQQRLKDLSLYAAGIDASFGGGTEAGVKNFQLRQRIPATGIVDAATWGLLFPGAPAPVSPLAAAGMEERCLALTGTFETGAQPPECFCGLNGSFDGQGVSFGALQWNIKQGTLQPLLIQMVEQHEDVCQSIFHENLDTLKTLGRASLADQLDFATSIQTSQFQIIEPWRGMLKTLGRTAEFQAIQVSTALGTARKAALLCDSLGLASQRALALMFDIQNQNGGVDAITRSHILAEFVQISGVTGDDLEVAKMRIIANRIASRSNPRWADDVRVRKLTIAEGKGVVHGISFDLENVYCLTMAPFAASTSVGG